MGGIRKRVCGFGYSSGGGMVVEELLGAQKLVIISEMSPAAFEFLVLRPAATCSRVYYLQVRQ